MSNQSYLPEDLLKDTIEGMSTGDVGYTVAWAMWADEEGRLWINRNYTVKDNPNPGHTTRKLKIKRTKDGVEVFRDIIGDYRFSLGSDWTNGLPVVLK